MNYKYLFGFLIIIYSCGSTKELAYDFNRDKTEVIYQAAPEKAHARGIAVIENEIYCATNLGFVYQYKIDKQEFKQISQLELVELRDIFLLSEDYFIAVQADEQGKLLLSRGLVEERIHPFEKTTFLDGIDINEKGFGIVMGDPWADQIKVAITEDFGVTWKACDDPNLTSKNGEAGFAASGSNVQVLSSNSIAFVTGGTQSRFFRSDNKGKTWRANSLPFSKSPSSGPFSMHFWNENDGIVVGGDYTQANDTLNNCFLTNDGGKSWKKPKKTVKGYRSSVISCQGILFACGTNGIDVSFDFGQTWEKYKDLNSFALTTFKDKVYCTLKEGKVLEINLNKLNKINK